MATTVAGTFARVVEAQEAVERLRAEGVPAHDISMIVRDTEGTGETTAADAGVRGGAAGTLVNPVRPAAEPVIRERLEEDEVEPITAEEYEATATGTISGALIGGIGGFLVGLSTLALPGLGPVLAAGPIAAALGGSVLGAAAGGLIGALVDAGIPEEYASGYLADVERGHVLLTVNTDTASRARLREIMEEAGALRVYPERTTLV